MANESNLYVQQHSRYFISAGMAVVLLFSLAIYVLSWSIGGNDQLDTMGGRAGLSIVVIGLAVSMILARWTRPKDE